MPNGAGQALAVGGVMAVTGILNAMLEKHQLALQQTAQIQQGISEGKYSTAELGAIFADKKMAKSLAGEMDPEQYKQLAIGKRSALEKGAQMMLQGAASGKMKLEDPKSIQTYMGTAFTQAGMGANAPEEMQQLMGMVKSAEPSAIAAGKNATDIQKTGMEDVSKQRVATIGAEQRKETGAAHDASGERVAAIRANALITAARERSSGNVKWQANYLKSMKPEQVTAASRAGLAVANKDISTQIRKGQLAGPAAADAIDTADTRALSNVIPHIPEVIQGGDPKNAIVDTISSMADSLLVYDPATAKATSLKAYAKSQGYDIKNIKAIEPPPAIKRLIMNLAQGTLAQSSPEIERARGVYNTPMSPIFGVEPSEMGPEPAPDRSGEEETPSAD